MFIKKRLISRAQVFNILNQLDETGDLVRKPVSGRPKKLSKFDLNKLKRTVNNKTGQSQNRLSHDYGVHQSTISRNLKSEGVSYKKRGRAPKATEAQKQKQVVCLGELCKGLFSFENMTDIVLDDESWFTPDGSGLPGNTGYYSTDPTKTPHEVKFKTEAKYQPFKIMLWVVIGPKGIGDIFIKPPKDTFDGDMYRTKCLPKVCKYLDFHYGSRTDAIFWPDLATSHYSNKSQEHMKSLGLNFVPKSQNPPACPQIRPVENFFGDLKQKVYEGNRTFKSPEALERRIRKCIKNMTSQKSQICFLV